MEIAGNLLDAGAVGVNDPVDATLRLAVEPRHLDRGAKGEPLENAVTFAGALALRQDGRIDFHHLAIFPAIGSAGFEDLAHQGLVGEERVQQLLLGGSLLGELGQAARSAVAEDGDAHQIWSRERRKTAAA